MGGSGVRRRFASALAAAVAAAAVVLMFTANAMADPVEGCDPTQGQNCDTVTTTVTITPTPTPTEVTVTETVTVTPTPKSKPAPTTSAPRPTARTNDTQPSIPTVTQPPVDDEQPVSPPAATTSEPEVILPPAETAEPSPSPLVDVPDAAALPYEIRNASPQFDQAQLSRKLAVPAALLVLLALLGWLLFEGRLRRLAHAAAVGKMGPQPPPYPYGAGMMAYPGYPMQPYQQGPVVSYVPVPYPMPYPQPPYPYPPEAYQQQPPPPAYPQGVVIERTEDLPGGTQIYPVQGEPPSDEPPTRYRRPY